MARFKIEKVGKDGWTDWVQPIENGYKFVCCDCGLVHNMNFRTLNGRAQFQVSRNERSTGQKRRHKAKNGENSYIKEQLMPIMGTMTSLARILAQSDTIHGAEYVNAEDVQGVFDDIKVMVVRMGLYCDPA